MARRSSKSGLAEALVDIGKVLPTWAMLLAAFVSYVLLHKLATPLTPEALRAAAATGRASAVVGPQLVQTIAQFAQYLVPGLLVFGGALRWWHFRGNAALLRKASSPQGAAAVDGMSWREFERLIAAAFQREGYRVVDSGLRRSGADGGVDLTLQQDGETTLVQCKHWRAQQVGVEVLRDLYGAMAARGATGGIVVTSGRFSGPAKEFAEGRGLRLVDGRLLQAMLQAGRGEGTAERPRGRDAASARAEARGRTPNTSADGPGVALQALVSERAAGARSGAASTARPGPRTPDSTPAERAATRRPPSNAAAQGEAQTEPSSAAAPASRAQGPRPAARTQAAETRPAPLPSPPCPRCQGAMTLRLARSGSRAGQPFWGCNAFPDCRGTRDAG